MPAARTLLSAAFLVPSLLAAQAPLDSSLYAFIKRIRAIDNHAHPVAVDPADRDFDALPIDGFPPFAFPVRLNPDNPELIDAWREMYGYPYRDRTDAHLAELRATKARVRAEQGNAYPAWVLDRLGIDVQLANRMAMGPGLSAPRFAWVSFVDPLIFPLPTKALQVTPDRADLFPKTEKNLARYLKELGLSARPATLQGYLDKVVGPTLARMKANGAIAVKYEAAYLRHLDFGPATFAEARRVYERTRTAPASPAEYKPLQDYLFREVNRRAGAMGMAVHVHSADGAGGYFEATGSDPLLLESALNDTTLRRTTFVIVHGGWPYTRHTASLFAKPNVYADFSFLSNMLPASVLAGVLREWLGMYPDRVLFGSDAYANDDVVGWEEWAWLGVSAGRKGLALALSGMVADGEITRARAEEIARMVLRDNALRVYRLQ